MIAVDTNIVAHLYIPSDFSNAAEEVLRKDSDWIVPRLWRSEFRNVLATHLRMGKMAFEDAVEAMIRAEELLGDHEYEMSSLAILTLSHRSGASAFDCEFVALAQQFGIPLVSMDRRLRTAFPQTVITLEEWLRW